MTAQAFLEKWNFRFSKEITDWLTTLEYPNHEEIIAATLNYAIAYADYFDEDGETLRFLKAICVRVVFWADKDLAAAIGSGRGRLWERCVSSLPPNPKRLARLLTLENKAFTEILQDFPCLSEKIEVKSTKEKITIDDLLFKYIRYQISRSKHAATAMRYEVERALIPGDTE